MIKIFTPTSLAQIFDYYIMTLSNGTVFSFDLDGSILCKEILMIFLKHQLKFLMIT